jgi:hypothetical protein
MFSNAALFSDPTDVQNAIQWAEHVQALGDLIVVGMGPSVDMASLTRLASPSSAFNWPDYNAPPPDLATRIVGAFQCSFSSTLAASTASGAATSPAATTSTAAAATTTMPVTGPTTSGQACTPPTTAVPAQPCQANFALLIDTSNGTTAAQFDQQEQFIVQKLFQAGWTYSQWAIANYDSTFQIDISYASLNSLGEAQGAITGSIFQSSPPQVANIAT